MPSFSFDTSASAAASEASSSCASFFRPLCVTLMRLRRRSVVDATRRTSVYGDGNYEVEFSDEKGITLAQIVVAENELVAAPEPTA